MDRFWKYRLDHGLFWTGTVFFHAFTRLGLIQKAGEGQFLLEIVVRNTLLAGVIYVNLLVLIPRLAQQKKIRIVCVYFVIQPCLVCHGQERPRCLFVRLRHWG